MVIWMKDPTVESVSKQKSIYRRFISSQAFVNFRRPADTAIVSLVVWWNGISPQVIIHTHPNPNPSLSQQPRI